MGRPVLHIAKFAHSKRALLSQQKSPTIAAKEPCDHSKRALLKADGAPGFGRRNSLRRDSLEFSLQFKALVRYNGAPGFARRDSV